MSEKWDLNIFVTEFTIKRKLNNENNQVYDFSMWDGSEWNGVTSFNMTEEELKNLRDMINIALKSV